jgi:NADH-quinone oxidoreductase subunit L
MTDLPLWLIPAIPLLASGLILGLPARRAAFGYIASFAVLVSAALSFFNLLASNSGVFRSDLFHVPLAGRTLQIGYVPDPLASIMALVVSWIATPVLFYSIGYMQDEEAHRRFFAMLSLFTAAMLSLVLAGDYLLLYLSWEIVGFCSYQLIGHETVSEKSAKAALKAFAVTRVGDLGLLAGMGLLLIHVNALDFWHVFASLSGGAHGYWWLAVALLLVLGATGKSAQFPLHWWLPDAMAGPTPVSALLHSATMVAAGVYLLARSLPILHAIPLAHTLVLAIGVVTAIGAAACACVQTDLKRLLAYSTMSQIGEMFLALAIGGTLPGTFHLIAQATFKALLFLAAGMVVKQAGTNELSKLGGGSRSAYVGFLVGALSLSGFPPFAGFWSRAAISRDSHGAISTVLFLLTLLSGFYIARAFLLAFAPHTGDTQPEPGSMRAGVYVLLVFTTIAGFLQSPWQHGWLGRFLEQPQSTHFELSLLVDPALAALGWVAALVLYRRHPERAKTARWRRLLATGFGTDSLPSAVAYVAFAFARMLDWCESNIFNRTAEGAVDAVLWFARNNALIDARVIDGPVMTSAERLDALGGQARKLQTGKVYHYLAAAFAWIIIVAVIALIARVS